MSCFDFFEKPLASNGLRPRPRKWSTSFRSTKEILNPNSNNCWPVSQWSVQPTWTASTGAGSHLVVAELLPTLVLGDLGGLQLLLTLLCLGHLLLVLVEGLEVAGDDGDGQGEDQHPGHGAHRAHQLAQTWQM